MSSQNLRKSALAVAATVLIALGAATIKADDPHTQARELSAIGVGSTALTLFGPPTVCQPGFIAQGTLSGGAPLGNAIFTLTVGNPTPLAPGTKCAAKPAAAPAAAPAADPLGSLTITTRNGSILAMDVAVTTGDSGESYLGTISAPNNVSGPNGDAITSAVSSGDFQDVVGAGHLVFGTGYNPNTNTYGTTQTIILDGTFVFPKN